jgi:drug/metabolite transporter (DMT)-like permease
MWSINGSVSKTLLETGISSMRLSQLRVSFAWLVLFIIIAATRRSALRINGRKEFLLLALYGLLGVTMTQWLYFVAIYLLPVGVALIIEFTAPLMVAMWMKFVWSHHVPKMTWVGLVIALSGLVLITEVWNGFTLDPLGVLAAVGAALALALYFIAGEKAIHNGRDTMSLTMWGFAFATLFWAILQPWWSFPWDYLVGNAQPWGADGVSIPLPAMATWMVILGTVLPFWFALKAMQDISAQQASAVGMTEPVLASVIAWLVMGESLSAWQIAGGIITMSGIALGEHARR